MTDRTETAYGLRWNSFFTCSDMTTEEVSRSQLTLSLWADYFQRGETKLGEPCVVSILFLIFIDTLYAHTMCGIEQNVHSSILSKSS